MYPYFSKNSEEITTTNYKQNLIEEEKTYEIKEENEFNNYILDMLLEAIEQENYDMRYFEQLSMLVQDERHKEILRRIHLEDTKHFNMFKQLYKGLTSKEPIFEYDEVEIDDNLQEEIMDTIEQKLENIQLYRNLMSSFLDVGIRDMIFEIITDEQAHIQRLSKL